MKPLFKILLLLCVSASLRFNASGSGPATINFQMVRFTGLTNNRAITIALRSQGQINSTNIIFGTPLVLQPTNGLASCSLLAATYNVSVDGINKVFTMPVPDTTNAYNAIDLINSGLIQDQAFPAFAAGTNVTFITNYVAGFPVVTVNLSTNAGSLPPLNPAYVFIGNSATNSIQTNINGDASLNTNGYLQLASGTNGVLGITNVGGTQARIHLSHTGGTPSTDDIVQSFGGIQIAGANIGSDGSISTGGSGHFNGSGSGITSLNAGNVSSGNLPTANLPVLNPAFVFIVNAASNAIQTNLTGDVTLNTNGVATLAATGVTAGTATKVTVDAKGRVTGTNALADADIPAQELRTNGNGSGLTNLDAGTTSVSDFSAAADPVNAAFLQWTNRLGALYFPNIPAGNFTSQTLSAAHFPSFDTTISSLNIRGQNNGSSVWNWTGTNGVMMKFSADPNPPVNLRDISLVDSGKHGTNFGFIETSATTGGGQGPIMWNNVAFHDLSVGAQIFNSGGFFYGQNQWNCGIGMFFPDLSDNQIIDLRSLGTTNAALVMQGKGNRVYYNGANEQMGILIGGGGDAFLQTSAEAVSNCVVGIGYPPGSTIFPTQTLTTHASAINSITIGGGYVLNGAVSNAASDNIPAFIKLWDEPQALFVVNEQLTGISGVISRTNIADNTPMTFDGVSVAGGSNAVTFSDGSVILAMNPNTHYGINMADKEYLAAILKYTRDTSGNITTAGNYAATNLYNAGNPANPFSSAANIGLRLGSQVSGVSVLSSGGVTNLWLGVAGHPNLTIDSGSATALWYAVPTMDFGGDELSDFNNRGNNTATFHGRIATYPTNYAGNATLGLLDSTVIVKANGVAVITLPNAASHAKGALYQLLNDGTTNFTVITTSNAGVSTNLQTIGNNSSQTNATIVPGQALQVQGDTANWKYTYSPGLLLTNPVSGQLQTNTYGRFIEVRASVVLSPASVSGTVAMWLSSSGYQTNFYSEGTIVGTIVAPMTNTLSLFVPPGNTWVFTNMSSGAGNSSSVLGGQLMVY